MGLIDWTPVDSLTLQSRGHGGIFSAAPRRLEKHPRELLRRKTVRPIGATGPKPAQKRGSRRRARAAP
jgi:hypothetical protein